MPPPDQLPGVTNSYVCSDTIAEERELDLEETAAAEAREGSMQLLHFDAADDVGDDAAKQDYLFFDK
jgi:hypothetical protein